MWIRLTDRLSKMLLGKEVTLRGLVSHANYSPMPAFGSTAYRFETSSHMQPLQPRQMDQSFLGRYFMYRKT